MPKILIEIENCHCCPFKTEYCGDPDYWVCDEVQRKIENLKEVPEWCPLLDAEEK